MSTNLPAVGGEGRGERGVFFSRGANGGQIRLVRFPISGGVRQPTSPIAPAAQKSVISLRGRPRRGGASPARGGRPGEAKSPAPWSTRDSGIATIHRSRGRGFAAGPEWGAERGEIDGALTGRKRNAFPPDVAKLQVKPRTTSVYPAYVVGRTPGPTRFFFDPIRADGSVRRRRHLSLRRRR